ncbi:SCO family protein [Inquilinus limosus]|uniref:SCO family protein n=1 Tax=Inquilinus limosus TaxID=171674 RepID=UPI0003FCA8C8|nr:SCO family protein [Inquilinus limosus]
MRARILVPVALALAAILIGAAGLLLLYPKDPAARPLVSGALPGGPFRLTDQTGATLSDADLKGRPFAVFFGFTHCPEICPTTLWEMSQALQALGPDADRLRVLFITVDPERDRPDMLQQYLQSFDRRIVGLTGSPEEIAAVAKSYRVYWRRVPTSDGDYTMDHSAMVYLMDAEGRFTELIAYGTPEPERMAALRRLIAGT